MNLAKLLIAIGATTTGFQRSIAAAERRVDALERRTSGLRKSFGRAAGGMAAFAKKAMFLGAVVLTALAVGLGAVVNASIQYEDAFAGVRKTVDATEPQLQALSKGIRQMSTEIPIAATELAGLAETAGALGVKTADILEFVRVTALLGVTTDVSAQQAADSLGILSNVLGLTSKDYSRFGSSLVALGNAGASTESQIIQIAERSGAAAKLIGLSTDQILGFASTIASIGMEPEAGGTALQTFFIKTLKFVAKGGAQLKILGRAAGMTGKQFKKAFEKDAGGALVKFFKGMDKLTSAEKLAVLEALKFTDARISRALLGLSDNSEELARQLGVSADAWERNSALTAEAEKRFATTKSQLGLLKNILFDIAITLGDAVLPVLTPLIKGLGEWISKNRDLIEQLAGRLATGIATVVSGISSWVTENGPLIRQVGTALFGALTTIWTVLTTKVIPALFGRGGKGGIIPAVIELGRKIFEWLVPKVQAFITTLTKPGGVIDSVMKVAGPVIGALVAGFGTVVDALFGTGKKRGLIPVIGELIGKLWGDGKGPLAVAVKGIAWFFEHILAKTIGKVIDEIRELIEDINTVLDLLPRLKSDLQTKGIFADVGRWWESITPDFKAGGGMLSVNRPTWVGEEGPELVFPRKSGMEVASNADSTAMAGGGDTYINVTLPGATRPMTVADVSRKLRRLGTLGYFEGSRATALAGA